MNTINGYDKSWRQSLIGTEQIWGWCDGGEIKYLCYTQVYIHVLKMSLKVLIGKTRMARAWTKERGRESEKKLMRFTSPREKGRKEAKLWSWGM